MNIFNLYDENTRNEAIIRMRSSGNIVPKKVSGKYIYDSEKTKAINSIKKSNNILIIHDFNDYNNAATLISQLSAIQDAIKNDEEYIKSPGYYPQPLNLKEYIEPINATNANNSNTAYKSYTGNIFTQEINKYTGKLNTDNVYDYIFELYDGSDLEISKYGVVILCTLQLPIKTTDVYRKNVLITTNNYNPENINITDPNGNNYYQVKDNYSEKFGINLQKYINSGGNVIMGNNIWQNTSIPNFKYENFPFIYKNSYKYNDVDIKTIKFNNENHPILKNCSNIIDFNPPIGKANIIVNMIQHNDSQLVATSQDGIPFISVLTSKSGSRNVAINSYFYKTSSTGKNLEMAKIIYNSIYWCLKFNN